MNIDVGKIVPEYTSFEYVSDTAALKDKFLNDAQNTRLKNVVQTAKSGIRYGFHKAINLPSDCCDCYIVMVKGSYDKILLDLGRKHQFPRGFPVLWIPGAPESIRYFGFLPKFSNDERQELDKFSVDDDIESMRFFKKWSGFLGQLLVFDIPHKNDNGNANRFVAWTVCSKNSCEHTSEFVIDAKRLFERYVTPQLTQKMLDSKLHICAEMISFKDQTHGSRAFKETPVVTVIGKQIIDAQPETGFVSFLDHQQVVEMCQHYGLPCDSAITIKGKKPCIAFLTALSMERDFMVDSKLNQLIQHLDESTGSVSVERGTISHAETVGECLEGLVIYLFTSNGTRSIKK